MQWNVLDRSDDWEQKSDAILNTLVKSRIDVATLQEIPTDEASSFARRLSKGGYGVYRNQSRETSHQSVIVWKRASMVALKYRSFDSMDAVSVQLLFKSSRGEGKLDKFTIASYHGAWGALAQQSRIDEVMRLDSELGNDGNVIATYLCGDFNAVPNEAGIRWLRGLDVINGKSAYWTEAQDVAEELKGTKPFMTSLSRGNEKSEETASNHGIDPNFMPERRIDYMFSKGWNYGHHGGWTGEVESVSNGSISDHAALIAETIR